MDTLKHIQHNWHLLLAIMACMALAFAVACREDQDDTSQDNSRPDLEYVNAPIPPGFPEMQVPSSNPLSREGIALGRRLYYDSTLSKGGPLEGMKCASCHNQEYGFSVFRPAGMPPLPHVNLAWQNHFLWNGEKEGSLEDVMLFEVKDFFQADPRYLAEQEHYRQAFRHVFGTEDITHENMAQALAQFFRTQTSGNSTVDKWLRGDTTVNDRIQRGYNLFFSEKADCFHCHGRPFYTDHSFHNIGLDSTFTGTQRGRENATGRPSDRGKFKTPTLRNVARRSPYMHDGRFLTLREVIEHYNEGVKHSPTLDPLMTKNDKDEGLGLNERDLDDLLAFLHALTDEEFLNREDLSDPFAAKR